MKWSEKLLPTDRKAWSDEQGECTESRYVFVSPIAVMDCRMIDVSTAWGERQALTQDRDSARLDVEWRVDAG